MEKQTERDEFEPLTETELDHVSGGDGRTGGGTGAGGGSGTGDNGGESHGGS